jgi:hypothetical protein
MVRMVALVIANFGEVVSSASSGFPKVNPPELGLKWNARKRRLSHPITWYVRSKEARIVLIGCLERKEDARTTDSHSADGLFDCGKSERGDRLYSPASTIHKNGNGF